LNYRKTFVLIALFFAISFLSVSIYKIENERRILKEDLIELSKIKYGLFSVDAWKKILSSIITKKVEELNFEGTKKEEMRQKISSLLYTVIDDFEKNFYKQNSNSFGGILKSLAASSLGAFDDIRKRVPVFTENIMAFLNDPQNKKAIRNYILEKLNEYSDNTFAKLDYTTHNMILAKYNYDARETALIGLQNQIITLDKKSEPYKIILIVITVTTIIWVFISKKFSKVQYLILLMISLLLLATGLVLPMIEIDARISQMSLTLLGESISFSDQVLYYKSKSILEVVSLMFRQSRLDVMFVGVLVLIFSVLFPMLKQIASLVFIFNQRVRENKMVRFMVFKTGKWSMADVMVIAIFMSYIGFSGIITEQLKQIEGIASSLEILTTNKSNLLTGFYFFTSFAIFSLSISQKIESTESVVH
jgi:hypothetical protein